jgi:hypothetical protein
MDRGSRDIIYSAGTSEVGAGLGWTGFEPMGRGRTRGERAFGFVPAWGCNASDRSLLYNSAGEFLAYFRLTICAGDFAEILALTACCVRPSTPERVDAGQDSTHGGSLTAAARQHRARAHARRGQARRAGHTLSAERASHSQRSRDPFERAGDLDEIIDFLAGPSSLVYPQ